jgi:hypothetical protein
MRDAATLEASGKPTAIVVNDVFAPIAHGTAALLALPPGYVEANIVWLPHPTSNLTRDAVRALVDERIDRLRDVLLGRLAADAAPPPAAGPGDELAIARATVAGLAASLQADGADLVLLDFSSGLLAGELRIGDLTCEDGSCIMPAESLAKMVEALVRPKIADLREVRLREVVSTGRAPAP